ncbi:GNAT family N-acetyltransferase [Streptomyces sp. NBC_00510]
MAAESEHMDRISVRQARHQDGESVGAFLAGLSVDSHHRRFFSPIRHVSPALVRKLVTVTPRQFVLLALDGDAVVGHVMAARTGERTVDVGIVVAEAYRYRGIGRRLVRELGSTLEALDCTQVCCDVLGENRFVLEWLRRLMPDLRLERSGATVTVRGSLTPHAA